MDEDNEPLSSQEVRNIILWILEAIDGLEAQDDDHTEWATEQMRTLVDRLLDRIGFYKRKRR
jgi:hypothetical protein